LWHKPSGIPTAGLRLADRYEYILHFSKNTNFFLNAAIVYNDYKNGLPFALYDSWRIVKKAGSIGKQFEHPAMFPDELAQRAIAIASLPNDIVLDPFLGSGTTMIAAIKSQRSCYGYELNVGYQPLIKHRLEKEFGMFGKVEFWKT
jgi:DNA modification methylase